MAANTQRQEARPEPSIVQGRFGRATINALARALVPHVHRQHNLLVCMDGPNPEFECSGVVYQLARSQALIIHPWRVHRKLPTEGKPTLFLAMLLEPEWVGATAPQLQTAADSGCAVQLLELSESQNAQCDRLARAIASNVTEPDSRIEDTVADFLRALAEAPHEIGGGVGASRSTDARIRRAIQYLRTAAQQNPSMETVAAEVGMSRSRFFEQFKSCVGSSPQQYLDSLRLMLATRMLTETTKAISEISADLNFSEPTHFSRFFTQHMGLTPGEFRRRTALISDDRPDGLAVGN
jgi:AraC-like DNA-binding protein